MAVIPRNAPRKRKKTGGLEEGPSRAKPPAKKKDTFKDARELDKFNKERRKRFGAK